VLTFTGSITLTGNVTIEKLKKLCSVKKTGTDLTAEGLQKSYVQTVLNVRQGKKITIGKKGILSCNPQIFFAEQTAPAAEYGIGIRMENAKGELLTFTAADRNFAVADITGGFANGDVYLTGQTNTLLVRSGSKLVYSGSTEGLWSWKADSGETAYFLSYADAVKEISRRKDTGAVYEMPLQENLFLKGNFVMPAKNTCKEFVLRGNGSSLESLQNLSGRTGGTFLRKTVLLS